MLAKQKQAIEAYHRVHLFLAAHSPPGSPGYLAQKAALDDVVRSLDNHAVAQALGRREGLGETRRKEVLVKALREQHLAPIAQIARAMLADAPGIQKALKMPDYYISPIKLLAEASAMRNSAALYEEQFINAGRPADFLEQLDAAVEALHQSLRGKSRALGRQVGGRAGIEKEIRRGRRVVEIIDTIVKSAFRDDSKVMAEWRSARRVRAVPGPAAGGTSAESEAAPGVTSVAADVGRSVTSQRTTRRAAS